MFKAMEAQVPLQATPSPPRTGQLTLRRAHEDAALSYYLYVPSSPLRPTTPILVSVHGISRNAREHARSFAAVAEREGVIVLSPLFTREFYADFQRLGTRTGHFADVALERMLEDAGALLGLDVRRFSLFGYSGGGQFAHRYALTRPERIAALAVAAPGWYTWPTLERRFPYGLLPHPRRSDLVCRLGEFLAIPLSVLVGALDTRRDDTLRRSRWIDDVEGKTRLERARRWFEALASLAESRGIERRAELQVLGGSGHDFLGSVRIDAMDVAVGRFFYGAGNSGPATSLPGAHS